ncbi:universal stress protein [Plasticicumulans acidivorans]|uniref:Nucleotide-binding universal stress UspA family protein n=1 Tax=Plasticicumulans acidivorans TaxID=886464 RepID=A0A317N1R6_9GAMM|nr:universal stress protein [Plasticicumulans acidivorans]PWV63233.1 nucleotide-binding universal stress UspA family protein [Plasticicumulans acidivorans]
MRLRRVLAATDLSAAAHRAAARAALIAAGHDARLELLHVLERDPLSRLRALLETASPDLAERLREQARQALHTLSAELHQRHALSAGCHLAEGDLLPELVAQSGRLEADLVVCGARGGNTLRQSLLGTTAERLLAHLEQPMLVVRREPGAGYRRVLVAVDFSRVSPAVIAAARALAPAAELLLLHAFRVPFEGALIGSGVDTVTLTHYRARLQEQAHQQLAALAAAADLPAARSSQLVLHGDAVQRILDQETAQDCDLLVLGKHGEPLLERIWLGSVTRDVLFAAQGDVLVVP